MPIGRDISMVLFSGEPNALSVEAAQHSEHRGYSGGSLRVFRQYTWLEAGSVKMALPRPTHPRVTLTVRLLVIAKTRAKNR